MGKEPEMKVSAYPTIINVVSDSTNTKVKNLLSQLSSDKKASAADPANVGISSRTSSEISSSVMAVKNTALSIAAVSKADTLLGDIDAKVERMQELAVKYNSGTLSDADTISAKVEFKSLQRDLSRVSSKYTEAAKANDLYSGDSKTGTDSIGTINRYTYDDNNEVTASTHTDVSWKDITAMDISDSEAAGKLGVATDFVSKATTKNAAKQKTLETQNAALVEQQSMLLDEEATLTDFDMASESTELTSSLMNNSAATAMNAQALNLNSFTTLSLLRG